jgi:protein-tyrosine phosphatase
LPSILFICTANKFRSPIAAALLQKEIDLLPDFAKWHIHSAGTWTTAGLPPPPITVQIGNRMGLAEIEQHRTRQVNGILLEDADMIIVMEANHKEALVNEFPAIQGKVSMLAEIFDGKVYDIPDPATPMVDAEEVANELAQLISKGFTKITTKAWLLAKTPYSGL